ncbi:interleukin-1 beta isoform X2 [Genypterus blacodes]|uniref:interleukin-1 beta isoform X2 n=1 Tax=Genypterus blacodes TaxID=154954 RepID=UPI003F7719D5
MSDFDLADAQDGPDVDKSTTAPPCWETTVHAGTRSFRLSQDVELRLSRKPPSLQCVAHLVVALGKMKKKLSLARSDEEVCSVILESLVEELVIDQAHSVSLGRQRRFQLCDGQQKDIVKSPEGFMLQAITLKGGHDHRKLSFVLSRYRTHSPDAVVTVALSIQNSNWYFSCSMDNDKAVFKLECSAEKLKAVNTDTSLKRFLFKKGEVAVSLTSFESVGCSGWFISTSPEEENQPVEMCQERATRCTTFKFNEVSV